MHTEDDVKSMLSDAKEMAVSMLGELPMEGRKAMFDETIAESMGSAERAASLILGKDRAQEMIVAWKAEIRLALDLPAD